MVKNIWEKQAYYQAIKDTHVSEGDDDGFIRLLRGMENKSILDVGCGEGWLIDRLSKKIDKSNLFTGIDVSKTGLERAAERQIVNANFICYDGSSFPFLDGSFDVAVSSFVFEHLSNPMSIFNEMMRVLKKGGLAIIICPNFGSPLLKSPCNKKNRLALMIKRFIMELTPKKDFKYDFHWNKVTPIELPEDVHLTDYDTMCEPNLSSFEKFLASNGDKFGIVEIDSLWDSYDYENMFAGTNSLGSSLLKRIVVGVGRFFGIKKLFRFEYFGFLFFAAVKKL